MPVKRTGISIPPDLLESLDELIKRLGIPSRSKAIAEAITRYIGDWTWVMGDEGKVIGAITMLYDHTEHDTMSKLTSIQHEFLDEIRSTVHVHVDERTCLEIIIVEGAVKRIREMVKRIEQIPSVMTLRFALTKTGQ